jgi:ribosome-binding protein aMBF1 (putative translation factor)
MQHQDWETVVFRKKKDPPVIASSFKTFEQKQFENLSNNNDPTPITHVNKGLRNAIIQGRLIKKMTQNDLARSLNMNVQTIKQIEDGSAIYNPNQIRLIASKLNINTKNLH